MKKSILLFFGILTIAAMAKTQSVATESSIVKESLKGKSTDSSSYSGTITINDNGKQTQFMCDVKIDNLRVKCQMVSNKIIYLMVDGKRITPEHYKDYETLLRKLNQTNDESAGRAKEESEQALRESEQAIKEAQELAENAKRESERARKEAQEMAGRSRKEAEAAIKDYNKALEDARKEYERAIKEYDKALKEADRILRQRIE